MNWMSWQGFVLPLIWIAPLLLLIYFSGKVKRRAVSILLKLIYAPYLILVAFSLYWFWGGDGTINLILVPIVLIAALLGSMKFLRPRFIHHLKPFDLTLFLVVFSGLCTVWVVVLVYLVLGKLLVIE